MDKVFKIGRLEFHLMKQLRDRDGAINDSAGFVSYVSWCYPSETIYFWNWELNIQNRRDPKKMYG